MAIGGPRLAGTLALAAMLIGQACGPGSTTGPSAPSAGSVVASQSPSAATSQPPPAASASSAVPSVPAGMFVNPVLRADFPDPFVLRVGDVYYAYATTDVSQNLQLARSSDLVTWEVLDDPLPKLAAWSSGDTWAPEVFQTSAGFVLYYTSRAPEIKRPDGSGSQCITLAVSAVPEGPFIDSSTEPLVCQAELGGSIDATAFEDPDGSRYLIWKNDGNCCGLPTRFTIQPLSDDGLRLTGKPSDMGVVNDEPWEAGLIEAPTLILEDGVYYLFYSANGYDTEFYAVGYATSTKVSGPYVDAPENPILASAWDRPVTSRARGPGHQSVVTTKDGQLWMAYHAWDEDAVGYANFGERTVWIDRLELADGTAVVKGPTGDPQPIP